MISITNPEKLRDTLNLCLFAQTTKRPLKGTLGLENLENISIII